MTRKSKKELKPKLRFPEFRDEPGWIEKKLGDAITLEYGKSLPEKDRNPGDVPVVGSNGIVGFHNMSLTNGPAIVIGRKGSAGHINWVKQDCFPIDTTYFVDIQNGRDYLKHFVWRTLESCKLDQIRDSGAVPGLNRNDVYAIRKSFPLPAEQSRIAECLCSIDELIAAHERKLELLKDYKKGLMQSLFPRPGETQPRLRFPEFRDGPEWARRTLASTCDLQAGTFVPAAEIYTDRTTGLYPCYGGNGLRGYTKSHTHKGKYSLIGRQGALCGNINQVDGQFHATEHALVVYPKDGIDTDWLYHLLGILNLNQYAIGQAQPGLSVGRLKDISLHVPIEEDEQHQIANCLSTLDQLMNACSMSIDGLVLHKKGLMQQLFPSPVSIEQDD
tara:strand:- start:10633 stop:11796 length:1164 start_codon:yes stop_codon:yes gene_type:complete